MNVLNLVSNDDARFYHQQTEALRARGVRSTTLTPPGEHVVREEVTSRSPVDYLRFVPDVLKHSLGDYDLIHANFGLTAPMAVVQPRLPVVVTLWGSDLFGEYGWLTRLCVPHCDAVIVMSEAMANELDRECHVIPHGVDTDRFAPEPKRDARRRLDWSPDARHVLFPYPPSDDVKDYPRAERIVEAARERVDARVELRVVYGVPHDQMPTYMNAADVLLLTSRSEGSPNAVKEALACDLPVVATDVGDVSERLDGVRPSAVCRSDGELVDGLVDVLSDPRRSNGREAVRDLTLERMAGRIHAVYEDVL